MSTTQSILLLGMVVYAIYRQTHTGEVKAQGRFKVALIYAAITVLSARQEGWTLPQGIGWAFLLAGIGLSAAVGTARGVLTLVWIDAEGRCMKKGTWQTVVLFLGMLVVKVGMGTFAGFHHIRDGASFPQVLAIVTVMVAVQAEIVFRRAQALTAPAPVPSMP